MEEQKKILIVGGGFGGIATALSLLKTSLSDTKITLVSDKPHFEYIPALYRVVTGKSPLEVCIPLAEIFKGKKVEVVVDRINKIEGDTRIALGTSGSRYAFDYLVLALGSETAYFNIPGLEKFSFGFKSISEALRLKRHFHELFSTYQKLTPEERKSEVHLLHFVVVGAGASGVELVGDLALYLKRLAKEHEVLESLIEIDLIEGAPVILPTFPLPVSLRIAQRLHALGVNIFTSRSMVKEEAEAIVMAGMEMKADTVIWTAGVKPNEFYKTIVGATFDKKGRVVVNEHLEILGLKNIFVVGDGASTEFSGMAQTAIHNGTFVGKVIRQLVHENPTLPYRTKKPYYSVPVGPGWASTMLGNFTFYGYFGWMLRKLADLRYFFSILPFGKALAAFQSGETLSEECPICSPKTNS